MNAGKLIAWSLCAAFSAAACGAADAHERLVPKAPAVDNDLSFYNTHTGERLTARTDTAGGRQAINRVLRDHRQNEVVRMNPRLLTLLQRLEASIERKKPGLNVEFHIISGYRSPETNEMLRQTRGGQAKKSLHTYGDAIDIRVPGLTTRELRDIAWCNRDGGVGYYPDSKFVHVDVGRVRTWPGAWERGVKCG